MKLTYDRIKNQPKVLISVTTFNQDEFGILSQYLEEEWQQYNKKYTLEGKVRNRSAGI